MKKTITPDGVWRWREDILTEDQLDELFYARHYYDNYGENGYDQKAIALVKIAKALDSITMQGIGVEVDLWSTEEESKDTIEHD